MSALGQPPGVALTRELSVGIHVPSVRVGGLEDAAAYARFFRACESLGFDAVWTEDRIFHPAALADPLMLLTWAAAHTERILLGTAVLMLNLRQAPVLARQLSTLQHFSHGRIAVGVSLGGHPGEYEGLKIPLETRVGVFRESLIVLRALLSGAPVDQVGERFSLAGATVRPGASIPILIGGIAPAAVRRAGRLGDGWIMAPFGSLDDFRRGWAAVTEAAREAGRDPDALIAGRLLYVHADENRARSRRELAEFLHGYYGERFNVDRDAIFGPPAEVAERLREQVDAGITHLMLGVPSLDVEHLGRLAREVIAPLRA